ncbi:MAG: hypothetical protein CMJ64_00215 [Planctomycetaceae bacterium]|jgi:cytochrome c551/c552|nr:hypothetical protein [Planctomycetaceae bacterium]
MSDTTQLASNGHAAAILILAVSIFGGATQAQDTPDYFRQNCMNCHTIGGGRLTGPDLKDVTKRKDRDWLAKFIANPKRVIDSGDPYARKILEESRNVPMPTLPGLTKERLENLLDLIEAESKKEALQFKGLEISNKPFTDADRALGRAIFLGHARLKPETRRASPATACTTHQLSAEANSVQI